MLKRRNEWKGNPEPLNVEPVNGYHIFIDFQAGYRVRDAGCWILDTGCSMLDARYWILDTGYSILNAGYWMINYQ